MARTDGFTATPDASSTVKGKVQLAGDLNGTAAAPTVANAKITPSKLATGAAAAYVATSETTTSTTYAFLTTTTDQVTVTVGANGLALVSIAATFFNSGANDSFIGIDVSGATTTAATDDMCIRQATTSAMQFGADFLFTGLASGSTTFKMKYRVSAGTGTFIRRRISAVPL